MGKALYNENDPLRILSLCDRSGIWSQPFADAGYEVTRIDIATGGGDVRLMDFPGEFYGIIMQPPCTHLAGSGARWWNAKGESALLDAMSVVDACLRLARMCNPTFWVLENPVGRLSRKLGPSRFIQHEYAGWSTDPTREAYTKRTCLWGEFAIPEKKPVDPVGGSMMVGLPPSADRAHLRSITPSGFARAFFAANHERIFLPLLSCQWEKTIQRR